MTKMPTEPLHKTLKHLWIPPNVSPLDGDAVASLNHVYNFQSGCCRNFLHIILCLDKECSYHLSALQCVKWTPTSNMLFNKESHSAPACLNVIAFKSPTASPPHHVELCPCCYWCWCAQPRLLLAPLPVCWGGAALEPDPHPDNDILVTAWTLPWTVLWTLWT